MPSPSWLGSLGYSVIQVLQRQRDCNTLVRVARETGSFRQYRIELVYLLFIYGPLSFTLDPHRHPSFHCPQLRDQVGRASKVPVEGNRRDASQLPAHLTEDLACQLKRGSIEAIKTSPCHGFQSTAGESPLVLLRLHGDPGIGPTRQMFKTKIRILLDREVKVSLFLSSWKVRRGSMF